MQLLNVELLRSTCPQSLAFLKVLLLTLNSCRYILESSMGKLLKMLAIHNLYLPNVFFKLVCLLASQHLSLSVTSWGFDTFGTTL